MNHPNQIILGKELSETYSSRKWKLIIVGIVVCSIISMWLYIIFPIYQDDKDPFFLYVIFVSIGALIIGILSLLEGFNQKKIKVYSNGFNNPRKYSLIYKLPKFIYWDKISKIEKEKNGIVEYIYIYINKRKTVILNSLMFSSSEWKLICNLIDGLNKID